MTKKARLLIASHMVVFAAGVAAGYKINSDELDTYRDLHESRFTRIKRKASQIGLGVFVIGGIALIGRLASGSKETNSAAIRS